LNEHASFPVAGRAAEPRPLPSSAVTALATAWRHTRINLRVYPYSLFAARVLAGLYTVGLAYYMYAHLFRGDVAGSFRALAGTEDYLTYAVIGGIVFFFLQGVLLNVGRMLILERREGTLLAILLTPTSRLAYLIGGMLQYSLMVGVESVVMIAAGLLLGADFSHLNLGAAAAGAFLSLIGFFGMGVLLGAVMLHTQDTFVTQNFVLAALYLVCGVVFPVEYLPTPLRWLGEAIPVTPALRLLRGALLQGSALGEQLPIVTHLVALSLIYFALGVGLLGRVERLAREAGNW